MTKTAAVSHIRLAAQAADEKLGEHIVALDVRDQSSVADYFLFVGASSHIHVRALEDGIRERLKEAGAELRRTDGQRGHLWRALDYGSLIVHIMDQKTREFYAIERLWSQGKRLDWGQKISAEKPAKKKPAKKKKK